VGYELAAAVVCAILGVVVGLLFAPQLTIVPFNLARRRLASMAVGELVAVAVGLLLGLIVGALLTFPLRALPGFLGAVTPILAAFAVCYITITIFVLRHRELAEYVTERRFLGGAPRKAQQPTAARFLLDTSSIIDGRIADVTATGFLSGSLIVPHFVLAELQSIADSADALRRGRGRRGLDILSQLQSDQNVQVEILDASRDNGVDVDSALVLIAREHSYPIITNDYNLNKVAALQGVKVLNVNELARAVKTIHLPGEDLIVRVIQEGKEFNQGVGYLADGTMVVVENGRRHINNDVDVTVTRVLQTVAGRMIFAHPNNDSAQSHR